MVSQATGCVRAHQARRDQEISCRIDRVAAELEVARSQMHLAQVAVHEAEEMLLARRLECEAAMAHLSDLADLLESLQRHA